MSYLSNPYEFAALDKKGRIYHLVNIGRYICGGETLCRKYVPDSLWREFKRLKKARLCKECAAVLRYNIQAAEEALQGYKKYLVEKPG